MRKKHEDIYFKNWRHFQSKQGQTVQKLQIATFWDIYYIYVYNLYKIQITVSKVLNFGSVPNLYLTASERLTEWFLVLHLAAKNRNNWFRLVLVWLEFIFEAFTGQQSVHTSLSIRLYLSQAWETIDL